MLVNLLFLLGIIFITYGIIVTTIGSGTGFFLAWLATGTLVVFFAFSLKYDIWSRVPTVIKGIAGLIVILGFILFICFEGMVVRAFKQEVKDGLDVIIVLGAQIYENGPSRSLQYRLDRAIEYLEENPATICIVTGGKGYNEPCTEAYGMAKYLKEKGVDDRRILLEDKSTTTEENIKNSRPMIEEGAKIGIVTNNFHVFRALQIARGQGLKKICGIPAKSTRFFLPNNMFREFFGEVKYLLTSIRRQI